MPTFTTNYDIPKPLVNSAVDQDLWGNELNNGMDIIDSTMKTISDSVPTDTVLIDLLYPVGTLYWNKTDNTNPGTLFGVGTWAAITDKFVVARGSTYTGTGGAADVTLAETNLPTSITVTVNVGDVNDIGTYGFARAENDHVSTLTQTLSNVGNATPFSIIPPYQAAYCWERTA